MATFTNVSAFADHVAKYGTKIEGAQPRAVKAAAEVAAIIIRQEGSRHKFKGRSGSKFPLGAKVDGPYGYAGNFIAYVKADPAGFWAMAEKGTKPHWIAPRGVTQGRRQRKNQRGAQALLGGGYGHPIARPVWHPGSKGIAGNPWKSAVARAKVAAPKAYQHEVLSALGRAA